jgi:hypothetical protein
MVVRIFFVIGEEVSLIRRGVQPLLADNADVLGQEQIIAPGARNSDVTHSDHTQMAQGNAACLKFLDRRRVVVRAVIDDLLGTARFQDTVLLSCSHLLEVLVYLTYYCLTACYLMKEVT